MDNLIVNVWASDIGLNPTSALENPTHVLILKYATFFYIFTVRYLRKLPRMKRGEEGRKESATSQERPEASKQGRD